MKKFLGVLAAILLVFALARVASAIPMTWTDIYNPDDIYFSGPNNDGVQSSSFTHNITRYGFDPGEDLVSTYDLSMNFLDDSSDDRREWVRIDLPGILSDTTTTINYSNVELGMSFAGWLQLNSTGLLDVTLTRRGGDFFFADSTLNAHGWESNPDGAPAPVPEPSTILLMGIGLLGLVGYSRMRFSKKS